MQILTDRQALESDRKDIGEYKEKLTVQKLQYYKRLLGPLYRLPFIINPIVWALLGLLLFFAGLGYSGYIDRHRPIEMKYEVNNFIERQLPKTGI